jgi:hypothetical protein
MNARSIFGLAAWGGWALALASPTSLVEGYAAAGAGPFDPSAGAAAWVQTHRPSGSTEPRSCASCHGEDLTRPGRHVTTGKRIEPLAPSANPDRLRDEAKVAKWFRRNCRWTLGRECTPQEKGDLVLFIESR